MSVDGLYFRRIQPGKVLFAVYLLSLMQSNFEHDFFADL